MENTTIGYVLAFVIFMATFAGTLVFFLRSWKDGYWGKHGEDVKYQVFNDTSGAGPRPAMAAHGAASQKGPSHA